MRVLILGTMILAAVAYGAFACVLFQQTGTLPEAALGELRKAFTSGDYSDAMRPLLERSLRSVPSSYQATLLHTVYRANRLEEPELIQKGFGPEGD